MGGGAKEAETLVKFCQVLFGTISHIYFFPASEILPMKNVNTIPHRLAVHVYFYYVYLDVVHEGFESVILLVLQIILVPLNSISSAFLVSRCKGSPYFRRKKMCEIFNHYSTGLFTCLVSIRSRRQETLKNSYTGTTDVACMQEMGIVTNASCLFSKCPTKVIIIVQTSNFAVLCINHHSTGKLKYFHVRRCLFEVLIAQDHEKSHCRAPPAFQDVCWNLSSRSDGR